MTVGQASTYWLSEPALLQAPVADLHGDRRLEPRHAARVKPSNGDTRRWRPRFRSSTTSARPTPSSTVPRETSSPWTFSPMNKRGLQGEQSKRGALHAQYTLRNCFWPALSTATGV